VWKKLKAKIKFTSKEPKEAKGEDILKKPQYRMMTPEEAIDEYGVAVVHDPSVLKKHNVYLRLTSDMIEELNSIASIPDKSARSCLLEQSGFYKKILGKTILDLFDTPLRAQAFLLLAEFISTGIISIDILNLSCNNLRQDSAPVLKAFAKSTIHTLNFSNNCVNEAAIADIIMCYKALHTLDLSGNDLGKFALLVAASIVNSDTVQKFNFSNNNLGENSVLFVEIIATSQMLRILDLSNNNLNSQHVVAVAQYIAKSNIISFAFSGNNLGQLKEGDMIEFLKILTNSKLRELDLSSNKLALYAETVAQYIAKSNIISFVFSGNNLGQLKEGDMIEFLKILTNSKLHELDLSSNKLALYAETVANYVAKSNIISFVFSGNNLGQLKEGDMIEFLKILTNSKLRELDLSSNKLALYAETVANYVAKSNIISFVFSDNNLGRNGELFAQIIITSQTLRELDLSSNNLACCDLAVSRTLATSKLDTLDLSDNFSCYTILYVTGEFTRVDTIKLLDTSNDPNIGRPNYCSNNSLAQLQEMMEYQHDQVPITIEIVTGLTQEIVQIIGDYNVCLQ